MMKNLLLLCATAILFSCGNTYRSYSPRDFGDRGGPITESLFDYKERTISEADIQRILDGNIELRDHLRIGIYKYGSQIKRYYSRGYWPDYDEDRIKIEQAGLDSLMAPIKGAKRVSEIRMMPFMITGPTPNIHQLREAAVRLQIDMLLIYTVAGDLYYQYRSFKKDEAKAYATCEAVLMDVRTGIIPHTGVTTKEFWDKKQPTDLNLDEMKRRVQNRAVLSSFTETGKKLFEYLERN